MLGISMNAFWAGPQYITAISVKESALSTPDGLELER